MEPLAVTTGNYESFAHRLLWDSAQRHLRIAKERSDDSWMLHLSAGLLSAVAFEAYLNYVGGEILPHVWNQERSYFSSSQYRGTAGKFKRIAEELGYAPPPKAHKPYAAWLELVSLRDKMVHARTKKESYRIVHKRSQFPRTPATWLYREASPSRVAGLIAQTEQLAVELHTLILNSEFCFVVFGGHPFIGALGVGGGSTQDVA